MENTNTHQHPAQAGKHKRRMRRRQPASLTKKITTSLEVGRLEPTLETAASCCAPARVHTRTPTASIPQIFLFFCSFSSSSCSTTSQSPRCCPLTWVAAPWGKVGGAKSLKKASMLIPSPFLFFSDVRNWCAKKSVRSHQP